MEKMAKKTELTGQQIRQIVKKVDKEKPAKADIEQFEELLTDTEAWRIVGDLVRVVKDQLVSAASGKSYLYKRSRDEGYEAIKTGLGYKGASMLEKLLIEQVAINWLRHYYIEFQYQARQPLFLRSACCQPEFAARPCGSGADDIGVGGGVSKDPPRSGGGAGA